MPPLTILRGRKGKRFTYVDRVLAIAHVMAENMLCPDCGQPKHEAYNPDSEGWYATKDETCNGCLALSQDSKAHKDGEYQPERKVHVIDERPPDVALQPYRFGD